jgi:alkaline phosphatase D
VLWTRLTGAGLTAQVPLRWELAHDERFTRLAASGDLSAHAADGHSARAEPTGLAPARGYFFRFIAQGQASPVGRTRTAPTPDAAAPLHLVLASCQRWDHGHWAAWAHVADPAREAPDAVLFAGDYIYEYPWLPMGPRRHSGGLTRTLDDYRARYAQYKGDPALQAAHAACPWWVTWDDHEVDNDYAGLQQAHLEGGFAERRAAAYQAWWEHMPVPQAWRPRNGQLSLQQRVDWGRLARLHIVDGRQHRSPQPCPLPGRGGSRTLPAADCPEQPDPARSLLGLPQEEWLAQGWDAQRPWNLLAQTTLMAPAAGPSGFWTDGWDGYPAARARLLAGIAQRKLPGAVVLGGDVHAHVVADLAHEGRTVAAEFCCSSISSRGRNQAGWEAARRANPHLHHARGDQRGAMRLKLDAQSLQAELLAVRDIDDPASAVDVAARFAVTAGRPGVQPG